MSVVIRVENLSKQYRLGSVGMGTIRDDVKRWWAAMRGKENPFAEVGEVNERDKKSEGDYVWALRDINFDVKQGEVLGVIGKNGAGKSTLLKILSKITSPTSGSVKVKGRIASLLEVGTGFHAELSGRENVFQSGAILGMTKNEIRSKFDEIVEFSGVAKYINTPVKRYSSGMYVRLAFAVAAHLEPEILIVDEVLAVGDAEFQKKCLGKMKDVSKQGRTVLFVSHNMAAVKSLCQKGILLKDGRIIINDTVDTTIFNYLKIDGIESNDKRFVPPIKAEDVEIHSVKIYSKGKEPSEPIIEGEEIELAAEIDIPESTENYYVVYHLYNDLGDVMFAFSHLNDGLSLRAGKNNLVCKFPGNFFNTGRFILKMIIMIDKKSIIFSDDHIASFLVIEKQRSIGSWMGRTPGYLKPSFNWVNL
jgi:lipopolysaccharide transport system ATP-binding protein